jgi:hypothetical protein
MLAGLNSGAGYFTHPLVCTRLDHVVFYHCGYDVYSLSINQNGDLPMLAVVLGNEWGAWGQF